MVKMLDYTVSDSGTVFLNAPTGPNRKTLGVHIGLTQLVDV